MKKTVKYIIVFVLIMFIVTFAKVVVKQIVPKNSTVYETLFERRGIYGESLWSRTVPFISLPFIYLIYRIEAKKTKINANDIKTNGTLVFAENISVRTMNNSNGGVVYYIICEWIDEISNEKRVFRTGRFIVIHR